MALLLRILDGRAGRAVSRCVARRVRRVWSVFRVVFGCALIYARPHRAFRGDWSGGNALQTLPESFGQLTALTTLWLSLRSACAKVSRGACVCAVCA